MRGRSGKPAAKDSIPGNGRMLSPMRFPSPLRCCFSILLLGVLASIGPAARARAQVTPGPPVTPQMLQTDFRSAPGSSSNINGVLEPGETVQVAPFWTNASTTPQAFTGAASGLTGPAGPTYTINDAAA